MSRAADPHATSAIRDDALDGAAGERPARVLVLDLGTSYFKASLFSADATLQATQSIATPITRNDGTHVEIEVGVFRRQLTELVKSLAAPADALRDVAAVVFATQTNSFALFDDQGEPLTPLVLWSDTRAVDTQFPLQALFETSAAYATTGVPEINHLFLPAKIAWLARNTPAVMERAACLGLMSDYLTWWLTGRWITEAGAAGLTGLVDIHQLRWWPEACAASQIPLPWLPEIVRGGADAGPIREAVAEPWGLPRGCRFIVGCLDQYAGAAGLGNSRPGLVSATAGTVLATIRCANRFDPRLTDCVFQGPGAREGMVYQMVFSETSAGLLQRYREACAPEKTFRELDELAAATPPGAEGLCLRRDASRRPAAEMFDHRRPTHAEGHEVRAILEGIAAELARQLDRLCGGERPPQVFAGGGGARSKLLLEIMTAAAGCPVVATQCAEPTSRGAALLALETLNGLDDQEGSAGPLARQGPRQPP